MGLNLSGLAINKNYENDFINLQKELGWNLEKQSEITIEIAQTTSDSEGICDVYFSEKGTLMFLGLEMCEVPWPLKNNNTLTFAISETAMAFKMDYCENGMEKRSVFELNGEIMEEEGEELSIESESEDTLEAVWNLVGDLLGKSFWEIEPDEKVMRYVFTREKEEEPPVVVKPKEKTPLKRSVPRKVHRPVSKNWWEFWK